jgi:predicted permease
MAPSSFLDAVPVLLLIVVGILLRASRVVDFKSGLVLTRLAYHVTIPAAIFNSVSRAHLTWNLLFLPAIGFVVPIALAGLAYVTTRRLANRPDVRGVMLVSMVVLGIFGYPFMQLYFGDEGLARIALVDVGNAFFAGTLALWFAQSFGAAARGEAPSLRPKTAIWRTVLASPILIASVLAVGVSALGITVDGPLGDFVGRLAAANTPLAMIAVGVFVRPRKAHLSLILQFVLLRMVLGGVLGWALALALGLRGLDVIIASTASALPAGTTGLVFAGKEGLDTEFAASLISFTVLLGILMVNLLPTLLARIYL